ncbi:unnamed protein product [Rotaria magnacalcarata]|uniref:Uncharacterized protein n=1 Tax=Rotaria magnacalcarata TaxID=392030 RepID=A0A820WN71_9BILA|nr:unnamed protein product [Rotaria magnacalcarata]
MSGESVSTDDNRSRSLLRQVREKFGGNRQRVERRAGSSSAALINTQRISAEHVETSNNQTKLHVDSTAPVSFSHHLSLLVNVKSRFRKTRKTSTALSSPGNDDRKALSLPPINSDSVSYLELKNLYVTIV